MEVDVYQGDITQLEIEAIVNPANSRLVMGGGLAGVIRSKGGKIIEDEARKQAPVEVGRAIATGSGKLPCDYVIHSPTMERPAQKVTSENARKAMRGILDCAEVEGINEIAVPGLGTGVGGVSPDEAAKAMVDVLKNFESDVIKKVVLVGYGDELYEAFKQEKERRFS